jgi:hypothetical protein
MFSRVQLLNGPVITTRLSGAEGLPSPMRRLSELSKPEQRTLKLNMSFLAGNGFRPVVTSFTQETRSEMFTQGVKPRPIERWGQVADEIRQEMGTVVDRVLRDVNLLEILAAKTGAKFPVAPHQFVSLFDNPVPIGEGSTYAGMKLVSFCVGNAVIGKGIPLFSLVPADDDEQGPYDAKHLLGYIERRVADRRSRENAPEAAN